MATSSSKNKGFSLIELSVVLGVLGIALMTVFSNIGEFRNTADQVESEQKLANIKAKLIKFARINKYLPCPDIIDVSGSVDGREKRGNANTCKEDLGTVPYIDIGMQRDEVIDSKGNFIRYVVNRETTSTSIMCQDVTSSSSYFCNSDPGNAFFTINETAPIALDPVTGNRNDGTGNYIVCNEFNSKCTGSKNLLTSAASVVLVAFGEGDCSSAKGAAAENCDTDLRYHQARITSEEGKQFDDIIEFISGYQIKSEILGPVVFWTSSQLQGIPNPTYNEYSLGDGDYQADTNGQDVIVVNENISSSLDLGSGDDYVLIGNDLSSGLEYDNKTGDIIDDGSQASLLAGAGDDTIYINGDAKSDIDLGSGEDTFILGGDLAAELKGGDGNDKAWIQGNLIDGYDVTVGNPIDLGNQTIWERSLSRIPDIGEYTVTSYSESGNTITKTVEYRNVYDVDEISGDWRIRYNGTKVITTSTKSQNASSVVMGNGNDALWLGNSEKSQGEAGVLNSDIYGGDGYDTLILENYANWGEFEDSGQNLFVTGFELVVFSDNGTGKRLHCEWDNCGD